VGDIGKLSFALLSLLLVLNSNGNALYLEF
jgi:hypothetical protein